MAFPPRFMDELHSRISISELVGKKVALTRKGTGQFWGLCPFHNEKTASFSVSEDKGFYHCFGCGAHGDIISFVQQTEGLSFPEAVEKLAAMAGLEVPKSSPAEMKREKHRATLYDVLEQACRFYQSELHSDAGKRALSYLYARGIDDASIEGFRLGFSGGGKSLKSTLLANGVTEEQLFATGLFKHGDKGDYEYFKNRVMFPITDKRGRVIAFGGRVLDDSEPKYLNSPETELFHKGEVLYAFSKASVPAHNNKIIALVEGYMDVISLHQAGFDFAVAPLGTALTEAQIEQLWKIVPEPTICFDGDKAGFMAASRAADRVIPILKEGYSLKFVFLPEGLDPDEILKKQGKSALRDLLKSAKPLADFLWHKLVKGKVLNTPERKAALEKEIANLTSRITNKSVQNYYRRDFKNRLWERVNPHKKGGYGAVKPDLTSHLPSSKPNIGEGKMMLAYLICYPNYMAKWLEKITSLNFFTNGLTELAEVVENALIESDNLTREDMLDIIKKAGKEENLSFIASEMEMLQRTTKYGDEIDKEMQDRLTSLQLKTLNAEIEEAGKALAPYLDNPPAELWERYNALLAEKHKILNDFFD